MLRPIIVCALLATLIPSASAQQKPEAKDTVVELTVYPAAEPKPALKYQLLPTLDEMNSGNPILGYLKCFCEQQNLFFGKQVHDRQQELLGMPLKDLPIKETLNYGGIAAKRADEAARLTNPDWETLIPLKRDGVNLLLPEVQQMRALVQVLSVRLRGELAARRFDDAIVTVKTMLAMGRHFEEHPSLIGNLVGLAFVRLVRLEEMIQQRGCPNLYWALTDLPSPLVRFHNGVRGERFMWRHELNVLNETRAMTNEELAKALAKAQYLLDLSPGRWKEKQKTVKGWIEAQAKDAAKMAGARKRLVEAGLIEQAVKNFPPAQVLLLDEAKALMQLLDDNYKAMKLPYWQAEKVFAALPKQKDTDVTLLSSLISPLAPQKIAIAQLRMKQRFAYLRIVEALRAYTASHEGKLPQKLSDVALPLPIDPVTGKPFTYSLDGKTATIGGSRPMGADSGEWSTKYRVTIGK